MKHFRLFSMLKDEVSSILPITEQLLPSLQRHHLLGNDTNTHALLHQHLLPTTTLLANSLSLLVDKQYWHGKPFSSNESVVAELQRNPDSHLIPYTIPNSLSNYMQEAQANLIELYQHNQFTQNQAEQLLVINDGAPSLIATVLQKRLNNTPVSRAAYVEQTTRGITYLKEKKLLAQLDGPLINVAGSATKRIIESYIIGEQMTQDINVMLKSMPADTKIGIVGGGGAIGHGIIQELAKSITNLHSIVAYNMKNYRNNNIDWRDSLEEVICEADCIIYATGTDVTRSLASEFIDRELFHGKPRVLINMGSYGELAHLTAHIEAELIQQQGKFSLNDFQEDLQCHNLTLRYHGAPFNLVKAASTGMLPNPHDDLPSFGLTRSLLFAGSVQALITLKLNAHNPNETCQMLHPLLQQLAVKSMAPIIKARYPEEEMAVMLENCQNLEYLQKNSLGFMPHPEVSAFIEEMISNLNPLHEAHSLTAKTH